MTMETSPDATSGRHQGGLLKTARQVRLQGVGDGWGKDAKMATGVQESQEPDLGTVRFEWHVDPRQRIYDARTGVRIPENGGGERTVR